MSTNDPTRSLAARVAALRPNPVAAALRSAWPFAIGIVFAFVLQVVIAPSISPFYAKLLLDIGVAIILAVSLNVVNGFAGQFSLGHAGFMMVGGYAAAIVTYYGSLKWLLPMDAESVEVFGAFMGFLWLDVGPLVAGAVAELFGLQWQAMIQGLAFMSHQLGSFLGAYGGGLIYDALGSYNMAWRIGVAVGLSAGIIQVAFALIRPTAAPPVLRTA